MPTLFTIDIQDLSNQLLKIDLEKVLYFRTLNIDLVVTFGNWLELSKYVCWLMFRLRISNLMLLYLNGLTLF